MMRLILPRPAVDLKVEIPTFASRSVGAYFSRAGVAEWQTQGT